MHRKSACWIWAALAASGGVALPDVPAPSATPAPTATPVPAEEPEETIVITAAAATTPERAGTSLTEVTARAIARIPVRNTFNGIVAATVPGAVALPGNGVRLRGSDNQYSYYLDGAPLPAGLAGSFADRVNPRLIDSLRVYTGRLPAQYGGQVAAVFDITAKAGSAQQRESSFEQLAAGDSTYETVLDYGGGARRLSYYVSGFRGSTGFRLNPPSREALHDDGLDQSGFAKFDFQSNPRDRWTLHLGHLRSRIEIPNTPAREAVGQDDVQRERGDFLNLIWRREQRRATARLAGYVQSARLRFDGSPQDLVPAPGAGGGAIRDDDDDEALISSFQNQRATTLGLRGDFTRDWRPGHQLGWGFDLKRVTGRQNFRLLSPPDTGFAPVVDERHLQGGDRSAYLQDDWRHGRWTINYGARYDDHDALADSSAWSPRLNVAYQAGRRDTIYGSYNRLFIPVPVEQEKILVGSSAIGENFSVAPVRPERDHVFEVGWQRRTPRITWALGAYAKKIVDILDNEVLGNTQIEVPLNEARGTVRGIETSLEASLSRRLSLYGSYAYSVGRASGPVTGGFVGAEEFPPGFFNDDHDQRHVATLTLDYQAPRGFASVNGAFGSGLPFGEARDAAGNLTAVNHLRLPSHFTLNLLAGMRLRHDTEVALLVTNVFDRRAVITQENLFRNEKWGQGRVAGVRVTRRF